MGALLALLTSSASAKVVSACVAVVVVAVLRSRCRSKPPTGRSFLGSCSIGMTPRDVEPCEVYRKGPADAKGLPTKTHVTAMSWNIQFCAGRNHLFFYEDGDVVVVPREDVDATMKVVAEVIAEAQPDIVLLQEVDRCSKRTHYVDQLEGILAHLEAAGHKYPFVVSTPYHQCSFVPTPLSLSQPVMGKVDFHMVTLSKYPIEKATRHQLPLLQESPLRQMFNLKRAVMDVRFPIAGGNGRFFSTLNTHLSAFAFNDGTPEREIAMLLKHTEELEGQKLPWLLCGDFNMLPPGDDPSRLGSDHAVYYDPTTSPIEPLLARHRSAMDLETWKKDAASLNMYIRFGAAAADRVLDWAILGSHTKLGKYNVLNHRHLDVASDHLPLMIQLEV